ncbi:MAG: SAM-dependent methyltransferase [Proteobacteria bacterium]|nr:MAG: SAM-dependent methyltransferase [Pseudomonadota bacterium]
MLYTRAVSDLRFEFGSNWQRFLEVLNEERIERAVSSLRRMLGSETLAGRSFLDVGSGSGLFSLAARRLGAKVVSFDYDPNSVRCTNTLKDRYFKNDPDWRIFQGSVLDPAFLKGLGTFHYVYSWGVLHHTGEMWKALANVDQLVLPGGRLCLAIYNDQGVVSRFWYYVKLLYNRSARWLRGLILLFFFLTKEITCFVTRLLTLRNPLPFERWRKRREERGMSIWFDHIDWIGGFPFEVATPEAIFDFYRQRGYTLEDLLTCGGGSGCCEYVFAKGARSERFESEPGSDRKAAYEAAPN